MPKLADCGWCETLEGYKPVYELNVINLKKFSGFKKCACRGQCKRNCGCARDKRKCVISCGCKGHCSLGTDDIRN